MASASKPDRPALVVGATGMLGSALSKKLKNEGWRVSETSRRVREVLGEVRPSVVFNCAAYSDVDGCEREPERAREANALLVKFLSEACSSSDIPLVHISTDYVFDGRKKAPYLETDPTLPINIYGLTKLEGEWYAGRCKTPTVIVRTSWLFGGANPSNFVNAIIRRLQNDAEVEVLDDQISAPTSVKDLSAALEKIGGRLVSGSSKGSFSLYHVCNTGATTRLEMTHRLKEWLGLCATVRRADPVVFQNRPALRPEYSVMGCGRFEEEFGVKMRPWGEAVREYVTCAS